MSFLQINQPCPKTIEDSGTEILLRDITKELEYSNCDIQTDNSTDLMKHSGKHKDEKFQCQLCAYKTTCARYLKTHSRKHTGDMLQCQHCDYTTVRSCDLKRHLRKHTGGTLQC